MTCKRCLERGKIWNGSDPKCAFETGVFRSDNWMCATMGELRRIVDEKAIYNEEQYGAMIPISEYGEFLVMSWYKRRGRTDLALFIHDENYTPITIKQAEEIITKNKLNATE